MSERKPIVTSFGEEWAPAFEVIRLIYPWLDNNSKAAKYAVELLARDAEEKIRANPDLLKMAEHFMTHGGTPKAPSLDFLKKQLTQQASTANAAAKREGLKTESSTPKIGRKGHSTGLESSPVESTPPMPVRASWGNSERLLGLSSNSAADRKGVAA